MFLFIACHARGLLISTKVIQFQVFLVKTFKMFHDSIENLRLPIQDEFEKLPLCLLHSLKRVSFFK